MTLRDPLLFTLALSALATFALLWERRRRAALSILDGWADEHRLGLQRHPPLSSLSFLEPLAVVPPITAVERLVTGILQMPGVVTAARLAVCLAGNQRRVRRYLLGIFDSAQELPALRVLPQDAADAPAELGFEPLAGAVLPPGYRAEAFGPLNGPYLEAVAACLQQAGGPFRIELRPGRVILAAPAEGPGQVRRLIDLHNGLQRVLALAVRDAGPRPAPGDEDGGVLRLPLKPSPGGWLN